MKRYLLFCGADYDGGAGGWNAFHSTYDSAEAAKQDAETVSLSSSEWAHIVDLELMEIVENAERTSPGRPHMKDGPLDWKKGTLRL